MPIKSGSTLVALRGSDGDVVAYRLGSPSKAGMLAIAGMAADGLGVALKVASMTKRDQVGPAALAGDLVVVPLKGGMAPGMILIFIDEANSVYFPSGHAAWDADVVRWNGLVAANGPPDFAAVHKVAGQPGYDIIPPDRTCPPEINYRTISRNPSAAELVAAYEDCKGDPTLPHPREVLICIDTSGSMTRYTMTPGIDPFEKWLDDGGTFTPDPAAPLPRIPWREVSFGSERWLGLTCDRYEDYR
jgi:hypothetical protein